MNKKNIIISTLLSSILFTTGCTDYNGENEDNLTLTQSVRTYASDANHPPKADSKSYKISTDTNLLERVTATDEDKNDTITGYELTQIPHHGSVEFNTTTGIFLYIPKIEFNHGKDCFKFKAIDKHNTLSDQATINIEVIDDSILVPNTPSSLVAQNITATTVKLTWQDNSENETEFIIFQNENMIAQTDANINSIEIKDLKAGESYEFCVKASNGAGCSASDKITVLTPNDLTLPTAPTKLIALKKNSTSVKLKWTDNANNEDGFKIYDDADNLIKTITSRCNQTTIKNLKSKKSYKFIIKAFNDAGESEPSNEIEVKTCPKH